MPAPIVTPTLLALAAGRGSRFGGPKQLAPVGPAGETILDFAIHDAVRAGFGNVVLVVAPEIRDAVDRVIAARWRARVPVALVEQYAPGRARPWGTAHAVLAAAPALDGPFAVVNGDDFYGRDAYRELAAFLTGRADDDPAHAVVGYALGGTLVDTGAVNRAVLAVAADGRLAGIEEVVGIERGADGAGVVLGAGGVVRRIAPETLVSMNAWGFTRAILPEIAADVEAFRAAHAGDDRAERVIAPVADALVRAGRARVHVLPGVGPWHGVTHPADVPRVARALADLVGRGAYPSPVWA